MQNPQDAGIFLFLKHLEGTCKAPSRRSRRTSASTAPRDSRSPPPQVSPRQGCPCARAVTPRSCTSAHAPAGGGSGGRSSRGSFRCALHPGSSFAAGDSFLWPFRRLQCCGTLAQPDHGVAQRARRPGSPGGKDTLFPDTSGSRERAKSAGWRAEGDPAAFGEPRPLPQVCAPRGAPTFSAGAKQVPPCVGVGRG